MAALIMLETDRRPIRVMPRDLSEKIAAGEVVERPSSVVRELIDNALDAGAQSIRVELRDGGMKLIRVTDNGWGLTRQELPLAFTSHATSKITTLDDLDHLATMGFRGEALPSIAAVARVEVQTRTHDEETGSVFEVEFGQARDVTVSSCPVGTRLTVTGLFANVPARRKFVRSLRAEVGHVTNVVAQYALAQPAVQFRLTVDGQDTFLSPGTGDLRDAVAAVYQPAVLNDLLPLAREEQAMRVSGLAGAPSLSRQNRTGIHVIVNGRPVANKSLSFALEQAYAGYLMVGRHPVVIARLTVLPADVDVNVHPAKAEVRFAREREVHGVLYRAVVDALLTTRSDTVAVNEERDLTSPWEIAGGVQPALLASDVQSAQTRPDREVPALRVFGQANATFIIAEGPDGLYMIDQHAAHERILFDQLDLHDGEARIVSQPLLEPAALELTPEQTEAMESNMTLLASLGFEVEPFGHGTCLVRAVPVLARGPLPLSGFAPLLDELAASLEPRNARERALASLACHAAVRAGQVLDVQEMREIVTQLERTPRPATCPHGRPTMIHLSNTRLEREFGRI